MTAEIILSNYLPIDVVGEYNRWIHAFPDFLWP